MQEIINIFLDNPIGQTFWILWMIVIISAFMQQDDKNVVKRLIYASFFWWAHFYFMEIYSGLAIVFVWLLRLVMSMKYKRNKNIFYFIVLLTIILWILTYKNPSSLLPIAASWLSTYWFFFLEKVKLRLVLLICWSFWFSFHYIHFSIWGIINESIIQFVHLYTIYKIISSEWKMEYYLLKLKNVFIKRPNIDYWRYLAIVDYIRMKRKK